MRFPDGQTLLALLAEIEEALVSKLPKALANLKISDPAYPALGSGN